MINVIIAILIAIAPTQSQDDTSDCGNGLPCGPIPWGLPIFPTLQSPTPLGTATNWIGTPFTSTPTYTPTPTYTLTPTYTPSITPTYTSTPSPSPTYTPTTQPTPTPYLTDVGLELVVGTMSAVNVTPNAVINIQGTTVAQGDIVQLAQDNSSLIFGYIRGIQTGLFGPFESLVVVITIMFFLVVFLFLGEQILTIVAIMYGLVRKVIQLIADILPG